jgi:DNA polymerase III subunit delta'
MWPVVGHEPALARLKRSLEKGNLGHAYLISGPPHVGKMTLALTLAQALNCRSSDSPCGTCSQCLRIVALSHPDVQVVTLGSAVSEEERSRSEIGITQVRNDIQHWASLPPFEGGYRVFIIGEAELLSEEAANCMLKTLEEPQEKVVFMLLTSEPKRLPETVISRCQRLDLKPVAVEKITASLVQRGLSPEKAGLISHISCGRPGWAFSAANDETVLNLRADRVEHLIDLIKGSLDSRFEYAGELSARFTQKKAEVRETLEDWLGVWRDLLLIKAGLSGELTNMDYSNRLQPLSAEFNITQIRDAIGAISLVQKHLRQNVSPRLALEVLMLDMPLYQK